MTTGSEITFRVPVLRLVVCVYLASVLSSLVTLAFEVALLFKLVAFNVDAINWNQAQLGSLLANKPLEMTQYLLGSAFLCLFSVYAYDLLTTDRWKTLLKLDQNLFPAADTYHQIGRICLLISANFIFASEISPSSFNQLLVHILLWIGMFQFPNLFNKSVSPLMVEVRKLCYNIQTNSSVRSNPKWKIIPWFLFGFALLEVFTFFKPFLERPKIINDFLNISETTLVKGTEVDNLKFIESNHLMSLNQRYDPRRDGENSPSLKVSDFVRLGTGGARFTDLFKEPGDQVLAGFAFQDAQVGDAWLQDTRQVEIQLLDRGPSSEAADFWENNREEIHWQILHAGMFHHQSHVYGPVNEYNLGRPTIDIFSQYGRFAIYLTYALMCLLGGITIANLYITSAFYYISYYFMAVLAIWYIGKRWEYAALMAYIAAWCCRGVGFKMAYLAPGFGPVRHYLDIVVLVLVYQFLKSPRWLSLVGVWIASWMAILNSNVWGLMLIGPFGMACICLAVKQGLLKIDKIFLAAIGGSISLSIFALNYHAGPDVSDYFFMGLNANYAPAGAMYNLLFGLGCVLIILLSLTNICASPLGYTVAFWSLYSLGAMLYPVWASRWTHFWSVCPVFGVLGILMVRLIYENRRKLALSMEIVSLRWLLGWLFLIVFFNYFGILEEQKTYEEIFKNHKTYIWPYKMARVESTVDPAYFNDSVDLIKKYGQGNGVYIISQYDYLLPFLAGKYSSMPFQDMAHFLITREDNLKTVDVLKRDKPEWLFVDRDAKRVMAVDILNPTSWAARLGMHEPENPVLPNIADSQWNFMYDRSIDRAFCLYNLHSIFTAVQADYKPVESSLLLTVYRRKNQQ